MNIAHKGYVIMKIQHAFDAVVDVNSALAAQIM